MRRLFQFVVNNVREHLMLYIILWSVIALIDLIYIIWAE
ncbi:YceO family protein [Yokenella regensburgei]